jgi:hypothetical protein
LLTIIATTITVTYRPFEIAEVSKLSIYLQSNDLQIREYQCVGQSFFPQLQIFSVCDTDVKEQFPLIVFQESNPHTIQTRNISYNNPTPLSIPFSWTFFDGTGQGPLLVDPKNKLPFCISPAIGTIPANGSAKFKVSFLPEEVGTHATFLILYMENVPLPRGEDHPYYRYKELDFERMSKLLQSDSIVTIDPLNFFTATTPLKEQQRHDEDDILAIGAIPCSHVRLFGKSIPINTRIQPPVLLFGNPLTIGVQVIRQVTIYNDGNCDAEFTWLQDNENSQFFDISFNPERGTIVSGKSTKITIKFTPFFIGDLNQQFICEIKHAKPISVTISAKVRLNLTVFNILKTTGPVLHIDAPAIDFGVVETGKERSTPIQITNVSDVGLKYEFFCPTQENMYENLFHFIHNLGNHSSHLNQIQITCDQKKAFLLRSQLRHQFP